MPRILIEEIVAPGPTCATCRHWQRHASINGKEWHGQGTCAALRLSSHLIVNGRPPFDTVVGVAAETNEDFACNRWVG